MDALFFSAGERGINAIGERREIHLGKRGPGDCVVDGGVASARMRNATEADDLFDAKREVQVAFLRENGAVAGEFADRPGGEGAVNECDAAGVGGEFAGKDAEQGAFARAVGTDDSGDAAGGEGERHAVEQRAAIAAHDKIGGGKDGSHG